MRSCIFAVIAAATLNLYAYEETIGSYTWSYEIDGDTATICKPYIDGGRLYYAVAVSPRPKGYITIPGTLGGKPVVCIGESALAASPGLTAVTIPDTVTEIGARAFSGCEGLKYVAMPDTVTSIGDYAFYSCGLTGIEIPSSVTNIGNQAFYQCDNLESISIPASVKNMGVGRMKVNYGNTVVYVNGRDTMANVLNNGNPDTGELDNVYLVPRANSKFIKALGYTSVWNDGDWKNEIVFSQSSQSERFGGFVENANNDSAVILSCRVRDDDPTILDVIYKVISARPTVKVRVLAFEDGERSFANVVRPETFVDGTAPSDWNAVGANVEQTLSWKVSADWSAKLAKVKFEVMTCEDGLLPLEIATVPASEKYGTMKVIRNRFSKCQIFDALLWLYADKDAGLTVNDGRLCKSDGTILVDGSSLEEDSEYSPAVGEWLYRCPAWEFVYSRMGYSVLGGDVLGYVNDELRLGLDASCYHGYRFVDE